MLNQNDIVLFEEARPRLLGLAYRILGTLADAEDAVQDTFVKWANTDRKKVANPGGWLTTVCTRRCLDLLRAAHRSRVNYVGAWLPEPIQQPIDNEAEVSLELASSLKTAFLLLLERLTPKERAAYLLREIFDLPYPEIAETLDMRESACRKLVSRAKSHIDQTRTRHTTPVERQDELMAAFQAAITQGTTDQLADLLSSEIQLTADGGGKVPTIQEILQGRSQVTAFMRERLHTYWAGREWEIVDINGQRGIVLRYQKEIEATISFAYDPAGRASHIYIVRNPEKLANLKQIAIH